MANWNPLRELLAAVDDRVTLSWSALEDIVGGLPRSAYDHPAFWSGDRTGWPDFRTTDVRVGRAVTFVRHTGAATAAARPIAAAATAALPLGGGHNRRVDVVLVGCVKSKRSHPAPAKDLYTSALFAKARAYAEDGGTPWFVLSATNGLVHPDSVLAPYDLRLSDTPAEYRAAWGQGVVDDLTQALGTLDQMVIEIHAGSTYSRALRDHLRAGGAEVVEPVAGLNIGQRLAWYRKGRAREEAADLAAEDIISRLASGDSAASPDDLISGDDGSLRTPGLYSWWVDPGGAADLSAGLGMPVSAGLIYAGLAGATRARSGRKSANTLWGRVVGMHLGGRHEFSTFRLSLGSVLASAVGAPEIHEPSLTAWMHNHLRVVTVPVGDGDGLDELESVVLAALDPPLNLAKMPKTLVRVRLSELRAQHSARRRPQAAAPAEGAPLTNRGIEDRAIQLVIDYEHAAGRRAEDTRGTGALADIEGDRLIEVKAFGRSARGSDLWLETRQVEAALTEPHRFHLVLVENVRTGQPRIIDIHGEQLQALLERRRERHYFEVPLPTGVFDALVTPEKAEPPASESPGE